MHCTFLFFSFLCLTSLSLSLSFSFLVMAPKKSILSKNSIRHGSFSSFSFPSDSIQFHNEKARDDFSDKAIHLERQVILSDFPDTLLFDVLALEDELLYVRNPRGVLMCSYRSFTPTCMTLIPLYLGLLRYFVVHVS